MVLVSLSATLGSAAAPKNPAAKKPAARRETTARVTIAFSDAWKQLVVTGNEPDTFNPSTVTPGSPLTLTWPHEEAGHLELSFGTVAPGTVIQIGFSETAKWIEA